MKLEIYLALIGSGVSEADAQTTANAIERGVNALVSAQHGNFEARAATVRLDAEIVRLEIQQTGLARDVQLMRAELLRQIESSSRRVNASVYIGFGLVLAVVIFLKFFV